MRSGRYITQPNQYKAFIPNNLPPEPRKDFLNQARLMYRESLSQYEGIETEYKRIAQEKGLNVGQVVPDLVGKMRGFALSGVTALAPPSVPSSSACRAVSVCGCTLSPLLLERTKFSLKR